MRPDGTILCEGGDRSPEGALAFSRHNGQFCISNNQLARTSFSASKNTGFLKSEIRAKNTVHRTRAVEGSREFQSPEFFEGGRGVVVLRFFL